MERHEPVYIIDGTRTPFIKAKGIPGNCSAGDLAVQAGKALLMRQNFQVENIDEVILGCVLSSPDEANVARVAALRLGCSITTPAWTVQRNCGSGLQALDSAVQSIRSGRSDIVLTGGTEAMSRTPFLWRQDFLHWLGQWKSARSFSARLNTLFRFHWKFLKPEIALLRGLTDPSTGLNMGQTAEELAYNFHITREQMDTYAFESHQKLAVAYDEKQLQCELTPLLDPVSGQIYTEDDGLRRATSLSSLAKLPPFFDKIYGSVTAGNSSQITDGACLLLLASEKAVKRYNVPILGRIIDTTWVGLSPAKMGLGPVYSMSQLLDTHKLTLDNLDAYEINEAFAAQVLACISCWKKDYAAQYGEIDLNKLNREGGAISLGHPVGASGARLVLHLLHSLKYRAEKKGMVSLCVGGGQGGAMLIEC